jgi:hypothetical protein
MKINEAKAAERIGIPVWTIRYHRKAGNPLVRYLNVEGRAWYDTEDLDAYKAAATVETTSRTVDV